MESNYHWNPEPHQRVWYEHTITGERGYWVRREGKDKIRLDRPSEEILRPLINTSATVAGEWRKIHDHKPLNVSQIYMVAHEADQTLCHVLGLSRKKKDWHAMKDEERIDWINKGPDNNEIRIALYRAIMEVLKPLAR